MTKALIVHIPKLFIENFEIKSFINYSPIGLYSLAKEIQKGGFEVEILNLGVEKYLNRDFLLSEYIKDNNIDFAAFSLNWHQQAFDVIETVRKIKEKNKNLFAVLGGYTSSYFAQEIMINFPFINAIIKGEGERSILPLLFAYKNNCFEGVPNLCYRKNEKIILTENFFIAKDADLDEFEFFAPELMKNFEYAAKLPFILNYSKENELNFMPSFAHNITIGRGCMGNCAWCGGSKNALFEISKRDFISFRSHEKIIDEIKSLKENYNIKIFRFSFDPNPKKREYLIELLNKIKNEFKGALSAVFTLDGLVDADFLKAFKLAFDKNSIITINPVFQNEFLRKKYKSFYFSNEELEKILDIMEKEEIKSEIYFSIIEGVNKAENQKSEEYGKKLKEKYKFVQNYYLHEIEQDPASLMFKNPEKYGISQNVKTFTDYYRENKSFTGSFENEAVFKKTRPAQ